MKLYPKVTILFLFVLVFFTNAEPNYEDYPTLVFSVKAYDKETQKDLENITVEIETYYDYTTSGCQPESAAVNAKAMLQRAISSNPKNYFSEKELERLKEQIEEENEIYQRDLEREKHPVRDTLTINSPYGETVRNPIRDIQL